MADLHPPILIESLKQIDALVENQILLNHPLHDPISSKDYFLNQYYIDHVYSLAKIYKLKSLYEINGMISERFITSTELLSGEWSIIGIVKS